MMQIEVKEIQIKIDKDIYCKATC